MLRLLPVAVISAAILGYEVLLMRLFSIVQWHHFAYMIISIALLGFGASGTVLALARSRLVERYGVTFAACAALFGVSSVASFALAERLPFNALEIVWDPGQLKWLAASYALLVVPFFFGGTCIGLAFARFRSEVGRVYAFDLIGAGAGALGVVALLFVLSPPEALRVMAALGFLAAALTAFQGSTVGHRMASAGLGGAALLVGLWLPASWTAVHMSQYKAQEMALTVPDARVVLERSSPLGQLSVVESPTIPFRHAPGLSLANTVEPPDQLGVFTDGDNLSVITAFDGNTAPLRYLDYTTSALPYHLLERPDVLVLGAGGGAGVLQAIVAGAGDIDAVELNPQVLGLVGNEFADFAGAIFERSDVDAHLGEARSFVATTGDRFDIIQLPLLDSFGTASAALHSLHESYIYTLEAFGDYLDALEPGGMIAITRWLKLPPRDALKLFATATQALELRGVADPGEHLVLIRSWKTTTLLVRNDPFTAEQMAAVRVFAAKRSFDLAWYPGISAEEANRYNLLERPYFYEGAMALLGPERADYIDRYKFTIEPASDDQPYFFDFFRWAYLPELLALRTQGAASMLDWGYLILFATLIQAAVLSTLLILLPLWLRRRRFDGGVPKARIGFYFLALGLAFLFIEIAFIQRFILFLGHPLYAISVVLAGFLVFAGFGSAVAPRFARWLEDRGAGEAGVASHLGPIDLSVGLIAVLAVAYLVLLPPTFAWLMPLPDAAKIGLSLLLIGPLAFFMGMPFPLGLARIGEISQDLVPWAWGINGCASVLSAVLATILAIHVGFTTVVVLAAVLYLAAAAALRWPRRRRTTLEEAGRPASARP